MSVHQCPKCELKFSIRTVLDDHIRNDHPEFHHDYPVHGVHHWDEANRSPASRPISSTQPKTY